MFMYSGQRKAVNMITSSLQAAQSEFEDILVSADEAESFARAYARHYMTLAGNQQVPPNADLYYEGSTHSMFHTTQSTNIILNHLLCFSLNDFS